MTQDNGWFLQPVSMPVLCEVKAILWVILLEWYCELLEFTMHRIGIGCNSTSHKSETFSWKAVCSLESIEKAPTIGS